MILFNELISNCRIYINYKILNELQSNRATIPKHQQKGKTHTMRLQSQIYKC